MTTIYFDTETAGLLETHPIIQLAAIAVDESWNELSTIEMKIHFDYEDADPEALRLNHWKAEVWREEAILRGLAVDKFYRFLEPHKHIQLKSKRTGRPFYVAQLAGHNAQTFDAPRLQYMFRERGAFLAADMRVLDTVQLAAWYFQVLRKPRPENLKLETLCKHFGIPSGDGETHDALADVRLTVALAKRISDELSV